MKNALPDLLSDGAGAAVYIHVGCDTFTIMLWAQSQSPHCKENSRRSGKLKPLDTASLFWGLLFGSIGVGFFLYGKKQRMAVPLLCGLALIIFPYFISNTFVLVVMGAITTALPYFFRL